MSARLSRPTTPIEHHFEGRNCTRRPRPSLCDVLCDRSASPWSLSAFRKFLAHNYCAEVLSFTAAVISYRNIYSLLQLSIPGSSEREALVVQAFAVWQDILDSYIAPSAINEINIPGGTKNALLAYNDPENPPSPDVLQLSYNLMYDLMGGIFVQFVESVEAKEMGSLCCGNDATHPCGNFRTAMSLSTEELPPHRRAHGLWGGTRVYRKIISRRSKTFSGEKNGSIM